MINKFYNLLLTYRPKQWVKNIFVFAPLVFSAGFIGPEGIEYVERSFIAFILFSLVSGTVYLINDCVDIEKDRLHEKKRHRPIAAGRISLGFGVFWGSLTAILVFSLSFIFSTKFFYTVLAYFILNILYSFWLKRVVILDVMIIAAGFVLRVFAGGAVTDIELSPWIMIITFVLSVFLGLIKRRQEYIRLIDVNGNMPETRKTLRKYNKDILDQLISITTGTTLISYIIYIIETDKGNEKMLLLTIPFVVFGIFRYLYLVYGEDKGESPEEVIFTDLPFALNIIFWVGSFVLLNYFL